MSNNERAIRQTAQLLERREQLRKYFGKCYEPAMEQAVTMLKGHMATMNEPNSVLAAINLCKTMKGDSPDVEDARQLVLVASVEIAEAS